MKPRILIIDDDQVITQQLFWTLTADYEVMTANDLQTAVRRATIYSPDISILDLRLPPAQNSPDVGLRILEYLKAHAPQSKVLVITAAEDIDAEATCHARGADEFLAKPFDTEQLLSIVHRLAPLRHLDISYPA